MLSRESLRRFHRGHQIPNSTECPLEGELEDIDIAKCLRSEGVYVGNSLDELGRERFHPTSFEEHFSEAPPNWLFASAVYPVRNVCSFSTIPQVSNTFSF